MTRALAGRQAKVRPLGAVLAHLSALPARRESKLSQCIAQCTARCVSRYVTLSHCIVPAMSEDDSSLRLK